MSEALTDATSSSESFSLEAGFGALTCFLDFGLVDLLSRNGQVRQDGHMIARDFDQALADGQEIVAAVLAHNDLARHHLRHQGDVLRKHAHLAFDSRQGDHVHVR